VCCFFLVVFLSFCVFLLGCVGGDRSPCVISPENLYVSGRCPLDFKHSDHFLGVFPIVSNF